MRTVSYLNRPIQKIPKCTLKQKKKTIKSVLIANKIPLTALYVTKLYRTPSKTYVAITFVRVVMKRLKPSTEMLALSAILNLMLKIYLW